MRVEYETNVSSKANAAARESYVTTKKKTGNDARERIGSSWRFLELGSVNEDAHDNTGESSNDGDGDDPSGNDPGEAAPVERLEVAVTEGNTERGSGNAHGSGDTGRVKAVRRRQDIRADR